MTFKTKLLTAASLMGSVAIATPAFAEGTTAGTQVTNTVSLSYRVADVQQNPVTATNTFTVDRKVNLTVAEEGTTTTIVAPGVTNAVTAFRVTNTSNAPLDFALAVSQLSGGTAAHGGTDNFDATNVRIYADTNGNNSFDSGDQLITYLDEVAADAGRLVFVVADIPIAQVNGDVAGVRLTATSREAGAAGSQGAVITETTGANTSGVDTVFADTNANGNTARDGAHFAGDDYTVSAATLSVTKASRVISDPLNNTTDPKMIPGAVVEYCIIVANGAGAATATDISISDVLPIETTYQTAYGVKTNGTMTGQTCNEGPDNGSFSNGTVSATIDNVAAGEARNVLFRVTVN